MNEFKYIYDDIFTKFINYCNEYIEIYPNLKNDFNVKINHSVNVSKDIMILSKHLGFDKRNSVILEIIGLLHDIGRFEQISKYETCVDYISLDHGQLGCQIIDKLDLIKKFDSIEKKLIKDTIFWHNKVNVPPIKNQKYNIFIKLLRDADKIDNYKLLENISSNHTKTIFGKFPKGENISQDVLLSIKKGELVKYNIIKNDIDHIFYYFAWLCDINFYSAIKLIIDRGYIKLIFSLLPVTNDINYAVKTVHNYLQKRFNKVINDFLVVDFDRNKSVKTAG